MRPSASITDPVNREILAVSEDRLTGFQRDPIGEIASRTGYAPELVLERIRAMLGAGSVRRVRQTVMATNLARGALVAWQVPAERLQEAFDQLFQCDPYSGHVVIRSTDGETAGSAYRLWTTVKVPDGFSLEAHTSYWANRIGAVSYRLMPAKRLFALGVGHTRRRTIEPGARSEEPGEVIDTELVRLTSEEWRVVVALKREFEPGEMVRDVWAARAAEAGLGVEAFCRVADSLDERGLIGRFSTFLEHVKPAVNGERATRYNALFHWAVPQGREIEAGREVGRHEILTHAYWREGGPEFGGVNIMAVAHGLDKGLLLDHKAAIDAHLDACGIAVGYTNVFWGGRSEIKPSEIAPSAYVEWCREAGLDTEVMRDAAPVGS